MIEFPFCNIIKKVLLEALDGDKFKLSEPDVKSLKEFEDNLHPVNKARRAGKEVAVQKSAMQMLHQTKVGSF